MTAAFKSAMNRGSDARNQCVIRRMRVKRKELALRKKLNSATFRGGGARSGPPLDQDPLSAVLAQAFVGIDHNHFRLSAL